MIARQVIYLDFKPSENWVGYFSNVYTWDPTGEVYGDYEMRNMSGYSEGKYLSWWDGDRAVTLHDFELAWNQLHVLWDMWAVHSGSLLTEEN